MRTVPAVLAFAVLAVGFASPGLADTEIYLGAATVVAREGNQTVFDNGVVACGPQVVEDAVSGLVGQQVGFGAGGACLRFDASGRVLVEDPTLPDPTEVAFQVCVDNNQDRFCSVQEGPGWDPFCADWIRFSHKGPPAAWANPMSGVPTGLLSGGTCPGAQPGAWDGLVVFVCSGVHDTHEHKTSAGTVTTGGTGGTPGFDAFDDASVYCGPPPGVPAVKAYVVG